MDKFRIRRSHLILMMIGMLFLLAAPTHCLPEYAAPTMPPAEVPGPTEPSCAHPEEEYCPPRGYSAVEEEEAPTMPPAEVPGPTESSCGHPEQYCPPRGVYSAVEEEEEGVNRVNEETVVPGADGP